MRALILAVSTFTAAVSAQAGLFNDCDQSASRNVSSPAGGISRVVIVGRAGYLHIEGHSGASEIRAEGTACAPDSSSLRDTKLVLTRNGSELRRQIQSAATPQQVLERVDTFFATLGRGVQVNSGCEEESEYKLDELAGVTDCSVSSG